MYKIKNYDENMDFYEFSSIHPFYGAYLKLHHLFLSSDNTEVTIDETLWDNLKLVASKFDEVNRWFSTHGCYCTINHCYRTMETQVRLLRQGLAGKNSLHLWALATDISVYDIKRQTLITKSKLLYLAKDMFNELGFTLEVVVYNNFIHITYDHKISRKINPKREFIISKLFTK